MHSNDGYLLCSHNQPHAQEREEAREKREMERSQTILQRLHVLDDKLNFALKHTHAHGSIRWNGARITRAGR